jgi:hypothetical protein
MYRYNTNVFIERVNDELVVHNNDTKKTYFLNETASTIFQSIKNSNMEELLSVLSSKYEASQEELYNDTNEIVAELMNYGLIYEE